MHVVVHNSESFEEKGTQLHWDHNKAYQILSLSSLRKITMVVSLAVQSSLWKLVIQGVRIGYEVLSDLLLYDELSLASYLYKTIALLTSAMQHVPKYVWSDLAHFLYNRLLFHGVRSALIASSTSIQSVLLSKFYTFKSSSLQLFKSCRNSF